MIRRMLERRGFWDGAILAVLALAAIGLTGGALVVVSGVAPIKASSGHWAITRWFLNFSMGRSVATHSLGVKAPPLDKPGLILQGAMHYEIGCRPCHGAPGQRQPRIPAAMTPHSPKLPPLIGGWEAAELFYIVKHGVKFTGMPAWPALGRDDEIWAVVAFLRKLPDLDGAAYSRLVDGDPAPAETPGDPRQIPRAVLASCQRCHGRDGLGRGSSVFPKLAGQRAEYQENALKSYARGERHSGTMEPVAAGLDDEAIREIARCYSTLPPPVPPPPGGEEGDRSAAIERGRSIAHRGIPAQRVPSCVDCHAAEGRRNKPVHPILAGQPADYLRLQLELFKKKHRGGSAHAHLMQAVAPRMEPGQMQDAAAYFSSIGRGN